jgi:RimJ/RimL family protein N-acetyltransferase
MAASRRDPAVVAPIPAEPSTREDSWRRLLCYLGHWSLFGYGVFTIVRVEDDAYVGEVGFFRYQREIGPDFDDYDEMGWALSSAYHGAGLASAACEAALAWAREHRPGRIVCMISDGNIASAALARRLGFVPFRTVRLRSVPVQLFACSV